MRSSPISRRACPPPACPARSMAWGWEQGTDLGYLQELVAYWQKGFSWRALEERLNALDQYSTEIDGQRIYFIHQRADRPGVLPLLLAHGWPGSVLEFLDVIEPLRNPLGGDQAFDLVIPALPGYGFSGPTTRPGWHRRAIAKAFVELMSVSATSGTGSREGTGAPSWWPTWPILRPTTSSVCT